MMKGRDFFWNGKVAEASLRDILDKSRPATVNEDVHDHFDLEIKFKIDAKGLKKIRRTDAEKNQNFHWIELRNVAGNKGWLYGKADFFAFELEDYWVMVRKEALINLVETKTIKEHRDRPTPYHLYGRKGRQDLLTLVSSYDLIYISAGFSKKEQKIN